jgi:molybdopterin-guanine dinucleotide biosynthesis protein A
MIKIPAIIFAGGKSSRMGEDKALLSFGGFHSLSQFQHHKLQKYFKNVYLSAKNDKFDFDCEVIKDRYEDSSPLVGIISIFESLDVEEVFILSVDAPFVDKKVIKRLFEACEINDNVIVAKSPSGIQPLCAIYRRTLLPLAKIQLEENNHKLQMLLNKAQTRIVNFDEDKTFMNLNHKEEYEKALLFDAKY